MKTVNDLLSNQPIIDAISLVISVIVPLLVMFLTFRFERNKSDREIKEREEQFDLELNNSKAQHEDTMRMQKRAEMAKILPFLNLENDVDIYYDKEKKRISLKMTIDETAQYLRENQKELIGRIKKGKYTPSPVRRVEIPKPDGGVRKLGIPTVTDRVIQQAIAQQLIIESECVSGNNGRSPELRREI